MGAGDIYINKISDEIIIWLRENSSELDDKVDLSFTNTVLPIINKFLNELKDKLNDEDFSKEELDEMFSLTLEQKPQLKNELENQLQRPLLSSENDILIKFSTYFEELLAQTWLQY